MVVELTCLKQPVAIRTEHVASQAAHIRVKQHSKSWSRGDFTIYRPMPEGLESSSRTEPVTLFSVDTKWASWTQRSSFRDSSGLPLFELSRNKIGATWFVILPGAATNQPIVKLLQRHSILKDKVDVAVSNAAADGSEVVLEVRGQDAWKLTTHVYLDGALVMHMQRTHKITPYVPGKGNEWDVHVAGGMDISLASVILVMLSQTMYNSSMYVSSGTVGAAFGAGIGVGLAAGGGC